MPNDICGWCEKPIYYGPRTPKTYRPNDPSSREKVWRHTDTEHRKCGIGIPYAWPVSKKGV